MKYKLFNFPLLLISSLLFIGCSSDTENGFDERLSSAMVFPDDTECSELNTVTASDSIPMLVVLVNYNNQTISSTSNTWMNKIFGKNSNELNHYYLEASSDKFEFAQAKENLGCENDGVVSVKINRDHPNVDIDDYNQFETTVYSDLALALEEVDEYVDFSLYDNNANGNITPNELLLTFIIAGYEDSYEGMHVENGIWAHQYCMNLTSNTPTLDSVSLMGCQEDGNFALFGETHDMSNPHDATIGVIAHELGHSAFSLPDLYNTIGAKGGIGFFGLMGAGSWTIKNDSEHAGHTPAHFSAWSKVYNGWTTPLEENGTVALNETSSDSYNVYKIPINDSEYYLLENRNNSGYDRGLYSLDGDFNGGIALWHINENKLTDLNFEYNNVNADTNNKGIDLVEASNPTLDIDTYAIGHEKALFYFGNVDFFENNISNISERSSQMTLNIN